MKEGQAVICSECKHAGNLLAGLPTVDAEHGRVHGERLRGIIVTRHGRCMGGTWCDCQHVVPALASPSGRAAAGTVSLAWPE